MALEKGHNEFIKTAKSPVLNSLIDKYKAMQRGNRSGKSYSNYIDDLY